MKKINRTNESISYKKEKNIGMKELGAGAYKVEVSKTDRVKIDKIVESSAKLFGKISEEFLNFRETKAKKK